MSIISSPGSLTYKYETKHSLSSSLFQFAQLIEDIENNDGVITDEMLPVLSQAELSISQKVDSYVNFADVVKGQIEQTKYTIDKFKKQVQTLDNLFKRLKDNVNNLMQEHNLVKIDGKERSIKLLNAGGVSAMTKPDDMFYQIDCVDKKYYCELADYLEEKIVFVVKDKEQFKKAVAEGKFESIFPAPRGKYVRFI